MKPTAFIHIAALGGIIPFEFVEARIIYGAKSHVGIHSDHLPVEKDEFGLYQKRGADTRLLGQDSSRTIIISVHPQRSYGEICRHGKPSFQVDIQSGGDDSASLDGAGDRAVIPLQHRIGIVIMFIAAGNAAGGK